MMTYTVHIFYSRNGTSDVEHFEMASNYGYGKGTLAQWKPTSPVSPSKKAR